MTTNSFTYCAYTTDMQSNMRLLLRTLSQKVRLRLWWLIADNVDLTVLRLRLMLNAASASTGHNTNLCSWCRNRLLQQMRLSGRGNHHKRLE